jgi:hypothetical protein
MEHKKCSKPTTSNCVEKWRRDGTQGATGQIQDPGGQARDRGIRGISGITDPRSGPVVVFEAAKDKIYGYGSIPKKIPFLEG